MINFSDCRVHGSGKKILMRPWCVGSNQAGIPELVAESILAFHQRRAYALPVNVLMFRYLLAAG